MVALHKDPSRPDLQNAAVGPDGVPQGVARTGAGREAVTGPLEESVMAQLSWGLQFLH